MGLSVEQVQVELIAMTRQFLTEQQATRALHLLALEASFSRQLGIDSLGKMELMHRIEKAFAIHFSNETLAEADNLNFILQAILTAKPAVQTTSKQFVEHWDAGAFDISHINTLAEALIFYATHQPQRAHIYLQDEYGKEKIISYGHLFDNAAKIANNLQALGVNINDTVAIMLPTSENFFYAFFGCLLAGAIPVPIYPPFRPNRIEEYIKREIRILKSAEVKVLIIFAETKMIGKLLQVEIPSLISVVNCEKLLEGKSQLPRMIYRPEQAALIQYTSGSTGDPKGVLLLNKNVIANIFAAKEAVGLNRNDVIISWLPLYHDMGLVSWLAALYLGIPFTVMSPLTFLNHPEKWLWAIHYHRGTISAGPNFSYELCVKKIDENSIEGLDLSCWRLALNGAEAINPETLTRFYQKFSPYGLKKTTIFPVYGLAENTVALAFPELEKEWRIDYIDKNTFETHHQAKIAVNRKNALAFVSVGKAVPRHEIRIVDETGKTLAEREIGLVQFRGPSTMQGYYRNPKETQAVFQQDWCNSGDYGYIAEGDLFITGRKKDLIIKAGRNLLPESFEAIIGNIAGIRKGCVAAFGVNDKKSGTEKIVIVAETSHLHSLEQEKLSKQIIERCSTNIGVSPDEIIFVKPHSIPKTSSGKLQRTACKQDYLNSVFSKKSRSFYQQIIPLALSAFCRKTAALFKKLFLFLYTLYSWLIFGLTFLPVYLAVLLSNKKTAGKTIKSWLKWLFKLTFCPIKIKGQTHITQKRPRVYVANHSSYTDVLVLLTLLPQGTVFIGKKELLRWPIISQLIKRLDFIAVDRFNFHQGIEDSQKIEMVLKNRQSILIFPEGTFSYASGIKLFKTGAFQLAVNTKTAIVPIAMQGTRKLLPGEHWLLKPSQISIEILPPLFPKENSWDEVNRLRKQAREMISQSVHEPLIDLTF